MLVNCHQSRGAFVFTLQIFIFTLQILISYNITCVNIAIKMYGAIQMIKSLQDQSFSTSLLSFSHATATKSNTTVFEAFSYLTCD